MYYQYFLAKKNNPSKLSLFQNTERTNDGLQTTAPTHKSSRSKLLITDRQNTDQSSTDGYLIKRHGVFTKQAKKSINIAINSIKQSIKMEIEKIKEECRIRQIPYQQFVLDAMNRNKENIELILIKLRKIQNNKTKRSLSIEIIQELNLHIAKIKNLDIKILVSLLLAKLARQYNLLQYSISLAKNAKRFADSEPMIKYKIKAYCLLAECFLKLRLKQAKIYITKYLMCSWKLGKINDELKCYDWLGKFYYYEGNIEMAQMFHNKMICGEILKINSSVKKLAISKFEQGSIGKGRKDKISFATEEGDLNISSDDEPFEIMFDQDKDQEQIKQKNIQQLISQKNQQQKNSLLHFQVRKQPLFEKTNLKRALQDKQIANSYIRVPKNNQTQSLITNNGTIDFTKIKGFSRANTKLGDLKNPVLLNHLSPNRCLVNYQFIELNKSAQSFKTVEGLEPLFEIGDVQKISKTLNKLIQILQGIEDWLDQSD